MKALLFEIGVFFDAVGLTLMMSYDEYMAKRMEKMERELDLEIMINTR